MGIVATEEEVLAGGNVSRVVRVGDTVRRPAGPWTPAVQALLAHLHAAGFQAVPRPLGLDDQGREVLSFVEGEIAWPDRPGLFDGVEAAARAGRLVHDFHQAVAGFTPPAEAVWNVLIPPDGEEIIAHNDLAPWNVVVGPDESWNVIDWDAAAPGTRLWDVAYALHGFVPLSADPRFHRVEHHERVRVFADAYGLDESERRRLVPLLGQRTRSMATFLRAQAAQGVEPWTTLWRAGHGTIWDTDAAWIEERDDQWLTTLLS